MGSPESLSPKGKSSPSKNNATRKFVFEAPPEAPVFKPTAEEFKDPLEYIKKIRPIGEKTGICKIIPPNWKNPFALDMNTLRFVPRIQRINELEARTRIKLNFSDKLTKFFALSGKTFQVPMMEKVSLDLYTLHRKVRELGGVETVNKEKRWGDIAQGMGFSGKNAQYTLKNHYDNLILPFLQSQARAREESKDDDDKENCDTEKVFDVETGEEIKKDSPSGKGTMRELKSLKFLGPGPKMAVCDGGSLQKGLRTRGKKIMYEFDPLAKYMCKGCKQGDIDETFLVMCIACEDRYHHSCLIPPLVDYPPNWRCPKCVAAEGYKPLEEFGFAQAEREYTLNEFKAMADEFKRNYFNSDPDHGAVEQEFWRVVSSIDEAVTVEYGADLHVIEHGSGFPRRGQPCVEGLDRKKFDKYADSAWNLNNLPVLEDSVLRHISADISGMKIPWMYAGMCFATFCWHNEDHWSYSINYLHMGDAKTWYGVPGSYAEQFEEAMQKAAPELFESQPDLLHQLVTIMNPNDIMAAGVPVYRTDQKRGEFVVTFPRAYHAGFNQGFNFAEACNFAPADWLVIGRECIHHYARLGRNCVFSHDELICKMAIMYDSLERDVGLVLVKDMAIMVESERLRRTRALRLGVGNAVHVEFDKLPDDERQCCICNTTVFLSAVACPCDFSRLACLDHITKLCNCETKNYIMKYQLKLDLLQNLLDMISSKLCGFGNWTSRVQEALNGREKKVSLRGLTELLVEAKEKEFPHSELIELLEYHVRRCIECSALSKALVANCSKKDSPSKITIEDLEQFFQEVEKLPCSISEEAAVKEILDKAKKFQSNSQKILSLEEPSKVRLLPCIEMGQSLNLDLPELQELEKRLMEIEWAEQVCFAIHSGADVDVRKLSEDGKAFPDSPIVLKTRKELETYMDENCSIAIVSVQSMAGCNQELLQIPVPPSIPVSGNNFGSNLEQSIHSVLSGEKILYLRNLENLVIQAKHHIPLSPLIKEMESHLSVTRNWERAAKKLFLKIDTDLGLMEALWPREFVKRNLFYSMQILKKASVLEVKLNKRDQRHFFPENFNKALRAEKESLFKLRQENFKSMDTDDFGIIKCPCGNSLDRSVIVCELCHTAMHLKCLRFMDKTTGSKVAPNVWDENFRTRRICGFCKRTNRPSLSIVSKLADAGLEMTVKIPECYVLKYAVSTVTRWRQKLRVLIDPSILSERSKHILSFFQKFHAKRYSSDPKSPELLDNSNLVIGEPIGIPRTVILALKAELIMGNRFEISTPELNDIWNIMNPLWVHAEIESKLFNGLCYPLGGDSASAQPNHANLSWFATAKRPIKRKPMPPPATTPGFVALKGPKKKKKKITPGPKKHVQKPAQLYSEEHEPETNCAAPVCTKPVDDAVDWVQCDGACKQWFHMKCVDLDNKDVNEDYEYICTICVCNRVCEQVTGTGTTSNVGS